MRNTWMLKPLALFSLLALMAACEEKVAPELSTPSSATGPTVPTTSTGSKSFSLQLMNTSTDQTPEVLQYVLHKTNSIGSVKCQVDNINSTPETLDSTRDISCFLEAEEFNLNFNGFAVKAVSDVNTCEYIATTPFLFWQYMPGLTARIDGSARRMAYIECDPKVISDASGMPIPASYGTAPAANTVGQMCGRYYNINGSSAYGSIDLSLSSTSFLTTGNIQSFCSFNYQVSPTETLNCDEGQILLQRIVVSGSDTDNDSLIDTLTVAGPAPTFNSCGGRVRNCLAGGGKQFIIDQNGETSFLQGTRTPIVHTEGEPGLVEMVIEPKFPDYPNYYFSNFMRQCSGAADFNNRSSYSVGLYDYDPKIISDYTGSGIQQALVQEKDDTFGELDVIKLADSPFNAGFGATELSGMSAGDYRRAYSNINIGAQPFYQFECLDQAFDLKARIRLVVREWNRVFAPTTEDFSHISDVYKLLTNPFATRPKMDAGSPVTAAEFTSPTLVTDSNFNFSPDWDDMLLFDNSANGNNAVCNENTVTNGAIAPFKSNLWFPGQYQ